MTTFPSKPQSSNLISSYQINNYSTLRLRPTSLKLCNELLTGRIDGFYFVSLDCSLSFSPRSTFPLFVPFVSPSPSLSSVLRSSPLLPQLCRSTSIHFRFLSLARFHSGSILLLSLTLFLQWGDDTQANCLPWKGLFQAASISWLRTHHISCGARA